MKVPEQYRMKDGPLSSDKSMGNSGCFQIPFPTKFKSLHRKLVGSSAKKDTCYTVISCDQGGWEHVSVSLSTRCLTWDEMCYIKSLFWSGDEAVMQLHVPVSEHINNHPYTLHLWRPLESEIPLPPSIYVGVMALNSISVI